MAKEVEALKYCDNNTVVGGRLDVRFEFWDEIP
jgi:hypothetical protein